MGFGSGVFLLAVGAILRFAVDVSTKGVDWHVVGVILMIAGALLIVLSLIFWSTWGGFHRREYVEDGPGGRRRVIDESA